MAPLFVGSYITKPVARSFRVLQLTGSGHPEDDA